MSNDDRDENRGRGTISPEDRAAIGRRASEIGQRLDEVKARRGGTRPPGDGGRGTALAKGLRASTELIGGIVVGGAIGWFLDEWLGSRPWLFILFFLLGSAAGILNIIRVAQRERTPPAPSVADDDDK
jgi:ATP synthase protein I